MQFPLLHFWDKTALASYMIWRRNGALGGKSSSVSKWSKCLRWEQIGRYFEPIQKFPVQQRLSADQVRLLFPQFTFHTFNILTKAKATLNWNSSVPRVLRAPVMCPIVTEQLSNSFQSFAARTGRTMANCQFTRRWPNLRKSTCVGGLPQDRPADYYKSTKYEIGLPKIRQWFSVLSY